MARKSLKKSRLPPHGRDSQINKNVPAFHQDSHACKAYAGGYRDSSVNLYMATDMTRMTSPTLVLIANHPQMSYLIERYGERSGCRVRSADTVGGAVELMQRDRPAMLLLHLTGWPHDGWPILRDVKPRCATLNIPITIISAVADEARARTEGATYWLWQPVMYNDFLALLVAAGMLPQSAAPAHTSAE